MIRNGLPSFRGFVELGDLINLACRDDCQSRLVLRHGRTWRVEHGPFEQRRFRHLGRYGWTLLVHGIERFVQEGRELLDRFSFIPHARLDDLMVSYAPPGGGVGPHFDHYDVFLLQGQGRRRWRVSNQDDLRLIADAPLKILQDFQPRGECVLDSGDLLYLPPRWAHDGISVEPCFTYSIGFRAPEYQQLGHAFLEWLDDQLALEGRYADPNLRATSHPGKLPRQLLADTCRLMNALRWDTRTVRDFLGTYLSEPKTQVRFSPPVRSLTRAGFVKKLEHCTIALSLNTCMLYHSVNIYVNGEHSRCDFPSATVLARLADERCLRGRQVRIHPRLLELTYLWYRAGYVTLRRDTPVA